MNKMYIKILRFLTDGSASETIELIMRTGMSTTKLQQISPAFVNKKMRLMAKKNNKPKKKKTKKARLDLPEYPTETEDSELWDFVQLHSWDFTIVERSRPGRKPIST